MSELMPEGMTQIRRLDVNFGIEELSAVDQQVGLAALAALAQDRPAEANDLSAKLPSQQDRRTDGIHIPNTAVGTAEMVTRCVFQ